MCVCMYVRTYLSHMLCMHMHVCTYELYVLRCMYVYTYVRMYVGASLCVFASEFGPLRVPVSACVRMRVCLCVRACAYECVYVGLCVGVHRLPMRTPLCLRLCD